MNCSHSCVPNIPEFSHLPIVGRHIPVVLVFLPFSPFFFLLSHFLITIMNVDIAMAPSPQQAFSGQGVLRISGFCVIEFFLKYMFFFILMWNCCFVIW